jgi:hypothetical protein
MVYGRPKGGGMVCDTSQVGVVLDNNGVGGRQGVGWVVMSRNHGNWENTCVLLLVLGVYQWLISA